MGCQFAFRVVAGLSFCAALIACGDENTTYVEQTTGIVSVDSLESCSDGNDGQVVFLTDSASFFVCSEEMWRPVNPESDAVLSKDTVVVRDTLVIKDTLYSKDTLVVRDSLLVKDSLILRDTIRSIDTLVFKDTVRSFDTLVFKDTLVSLDTIRSIDTVVVKDTLVMNHYDTLRIYDTTTVVYVPKYDTVNTEFLNQEMLANGEYGFFVDTRDNKVYRTIKIGTQIWIAQNLAYDDGGVTSYCRPNSVTGNGDDYCRRFGRLYSWAAALNLDDMYNSTRATETDGTEKYLRYPARGICPEGFHIPQQSEFNTLISYVDAKNKVDNVSSSVPAALESVDGFWEPAEGVPAPTNTTGFSAVANGSISSGFSATLLLVSSTEKSATQFARYQLHHTRTSFSIESADKGGFFSVRCLKDN